MPPLPPTWRSWGMAGREHRNSIVPIERIERTVIRASSGCRPRPSEGR
jgi:hypothetical protein